MQKGLIRKGLVLSVIVLLIGVSALSSVSSKSRFTSDDTTPPVTTYTLDPPVPDGLNGWYVNDVNVTLNATDDDSGVNMTKYRIDEDIWQTYTEPFILDDDGGDILVEFYSIDNAGNQEEIKSAEIGIDKTKPEINIAFYVIDGNPFEGWDLAFIATAYDDTSGMNRVEFYVNHELQETVNGSGPKYKWTYHYSLSYDNLSVMGLICNSKITDEYIKFFAIIIKILGPEWDLPSICAYGYDNAGNWDYDCIVETTPGSDIYYCFFEDFTIQNNYKGYIGRFLIYATFNI